MPVSFTSDRYGYSLALPAGWYVREEGAGTWRPTDLDYVGAGTDSFEEDHPRRGSLSDFPGITFGLYVSSHDAEGATLSEWTEQLARTMRWQSSCKKEPHRGEFSVGGESAILMTYDRSECSHDHHLLLVGVLHGDAGYAIMWLARRGETDSRRADFEQIIDTFRFTE